MAKTVYASADPAVVRNYAVLFIAPLPASERVRISYDHINGMSEPLTLSLVVLNDSDQPGAIDFFGGYAGPDVDAAAVGHTATASFFRERLSAAPRSAKLPAQARVPLIARGFAPQECLCGIFEIENRSAQPLRAAVVACGIGIAPSDAIGTFPAPPAAQTHASDDEQRFERNVLVPFNLPESSAFAGVLSTFDVTLSNDSGKDVPVDIVLDTKGISSGTLSINGTLFEVAQTPPQTPAVVDTVVVPAGACIFSIVIATDLNAPGPAVISFAPKTPPPGPTVRSTFAAAPKIAERAVPPLPAAAVKMDSSGSSERGVAVEVGARPPATATSRLAEPLATAVVSEAISLTPHHYGVIVEIDQRSRPIPALSRAAVQWMLSKVGLDGATSGSSDATHPFFFASMTAEQIVALLAADDELARRSRMRPLIARIWQDHVITPLIVDSVPTVKADAVHASFSALGEGIVWAVIDSGVERHPHFDLHQNLLLPDGLSHRDYLGSKPVDIAINNLIDDFGHGTHVAGIIAGEWQGSAPLAATRVRDEGTHRVSYVGSPLAGRVGGVAPKCKIVSMRVLDAMGTGYASGIISALEDVLAINDYGRNIRIHGVNLSVGYSFNPDWEACGATPVCAAVDRLVASGVIVVVAAGNSGDVLLASAHGGQRQTGAGISINDPGNAARAITVGSCYKKAPHTLGIAASSSKGPTGDGRPKPDLVAPGERVLSCAAAVRVAAAGCTPPISYIEDSGTSMAAPHVSGAAAAYLSARSEFVGRPDDIKSLMMDSATDLRRDRSFQGAGLIDVFRMFVNS